MKYHKFKVKQTINHVQLNATKLLHNFPSTANFGYEFCTKLQCCSTYYGSKQVKSKYFAFTPT